MKVTSFAPIVSEKAKVLILGSTPGQKSLKRQQYYAHSRNAFWQIMDVICGVSPDLPYEEKVRRLNGMGIAVWDVLQYCEREGSLDSAIDSDSEAPNNLEQFLESYPNIRYIFFNGKKAEESFRKRVLPDLSSNMRRRVTFTTLSSTSPANTRFTSEQKLGEWQKEITAVLQS